VEAGIYAVNADATTSFWAGRYSDLELYLMGLLPAEEVPAYHTMRNFRVVGFDEDRNKILLSGRVDTVRVEDIIDQVGARVPGSQAAQKAFRMGTVVVSFAPLEPVALAYYDRQTALLGSNTESDYAFAAATGYRATLDTRLDPTSTAVREEQKEQDVLPGDLNFAALMQNAPNPFNGATVIEYVLPQHSKVELIVYNLSGQQVAVLVDGERSAGRHALRWHGKDERGRVLASGIYFYQLRNKGRVETRKLSLVR